MEKTIRKILSGLFVFAFVTGYTLAQELEKHQKFTLEEVFDIEYANDPQISPDGSRVVYTRNFMDIMNDRVRSNLWIINSDGTRHRALTSGNNNNGSPRWSPDGNRLLYVSTEEGSSQLFIRWMDTGESAKITNLTESPGGLSWSPDGKWIALTMFVPESSRPMISLPGKPRGADWNDPATVIDKLQYRSDGNPGYVRDGYRHLFIVPAEGGVPRQLTFGSYNHGSTPQWTPDGKHLIISGNRHEEWEYDPRNSEIYRVSIEDESITALTDRQGPDFSPAISPDGRRIAYLGYDEKYEGYQVTNLYIMNADGSGKRLLTKDFDRDVNNIQWGGNNNGLFFQYDDKGNTKVAFIDLKGEVRNLADNVGGLSLGRPYAGGTFSVSRNGRFAFTHSRPDHPADVAVGTRASDVRRLTMLNEDLFGHKKLGEVEEIWYKSSHDGWDMQGWIVKPPDFDSGKKYPLILEIHGGPFANYGDRFTAEIQLMAAAGYVVLYTNPRGSTSYGREFGNYIHHNYPSQDYDDLMSGVDAVIEKGYIDEDRLYITGGSGGGVLTAWSIGMTDRFAAAVVAKPVINWYSFVLTSDGTTYHKYWFPGYPWENLEHYMKRSPISLVGNVTTPTMMLTGEQDYRTPMSETEQYYNALKMQKVESVMVRIPNASHGIASRPSNLMAKVAYILEWFDRH